MMALDCASARPSSNITVGTWPALLSLRNSVVRGLALERIDADPGIGQREHVADPFHLQAVARIGIAVDFHRLRGAPNRSRHRTSRNRAVKPDARRADQNL